jgi:hypothetical protein
MTLIWVSGETGTSHSDPFSSGVPFIAAGGPYVARWQNSESNQYWHITAFGTHRVILLDITLSRVVSDTGGGVIGNSPSTDPARHA